MRYDLCRPCAEEMTASGREIVKIKGGSDNKITCKKCKRRRFGATYEIKPLKKKKTEA